MYTYSKHQKLLRNVLLHVAVCCRSTSFDYRPDISTLKTHLSNNFSLAILANTMLSGLRGIFSFISLGNHWESDCVYVCAGWHNLNVTSRKEEHLNAALYSGDKFVCMCSHLLTLLCSCSFSVRENICVFSPAVFTSSVYFISKYSPFTFYIICLYLVFDVLFLSHS